MRGGVLQLARWGLLDDVIAAWTPPIRRASFHYADEVVAVPVPPFHGVDALYAPRRTVLDPVLVDAAVRAGAEVRFGTAVTDARRPGCPPSGVERDHRGRGGASGGCGRARRGARAAR
jgi:flavin-dependent dehydrogenase